MSRTGRGLWNLKLSQLFFRSDHGGVRNNLIWFAIYDAVFDNLVYALVEFL